VDVALAGSSPPAPFADAREVPLTRAPTVRVIAQARDLGNVSAMDDEAAAAFARAVRTWLPFDTKGKAIKLLVTPEGVVESQDEHSP
jgi:hypothetical protein